MTGAVLVVGEALIDIVRDIDGRRTEVVGGSPANVALGLARQGVDVRLLTALGPDVYGERIAAQLRAAGVVVDDASWSLAGTSTARAQILADGSAEYAFDVSWTLPDDLGPAAADLVHLGSISAFLEPGATTLEEWLGRSAGRTLVTFDPNIRPALLGDRERAVKRFERLVAKADVVKLSDEDGAWLYPGLSPAQIGETVLGLGARLVAVTRGAAGALLRVEGFELEVAAPTVTVQDTVGAGDTFMAALIRRVLAVPALLESPAPSELAAAGSYAVAAAALTVQRVGADLPTAAEILETMRRVERQLRD
ncbi:MAG: carbohydrate kinase [Protaetiibacter sp.]